MERRSFVKGALNKKGTRYSHIFERIPKHGDNRGHEETKEPTSSKKKLNNLFNSVSNKQDEELSSESVMGVDLDVMTKEPTCVNDEDIEFVLEIGDLQSVISHSYGSATKYSLDPVRKRNKTLLDKMYNAYDKVKGSKRVKLSEYTNEHDFTEAEEVIYDQNDFAKFVENNAKIKVKVNNSENTRSYSTNLPRKQDESLFKEINQQLEELCKEFGYCIDEIHTLWMEAWCDIEELKKVLKGEKNRQWNNLEDLALQSDPGSQEYELIKTFKAEDSIKKRKKFLEID